MKKKILAFLLMLVITFSTVITTVGIAVEAGVQDGKDAQNLSVNLTEGQAGGTSTGTIKTEAQLKALGVDVKKLDPATKASKSDGFIQPANNPAGSYYTLQKSSADNTNEVYMHGGLTRASSSTLKSADFAAVRGQSFVIEGWFKPESELNAYGTSLNLICAVTDFTSTQSGVLSGHTKTLVSLDSAGRLISGSNSLGKLSQTEFTHIAVYVTPKTNSYDVYVNGENKLNDEKFILDSEKSKYEIKPGDYTYSSKYNLTLSDEDARPNGNFVDGVEDYIYSYTRNLTFYSGLTALPGQILSFRDYLTYRTEKYYNCLIHEYAYLSHEHNTDGTAEVTYNCVFCGETKTQTAAMDKDGNLLCDYCEEEWKKTENPYRTYQEKVDNLNAAGAQIVAAKDFDTATGFWGSKTSELTVVEEYGNKYLMYTHTGATENKPSQVYTNLHTSWYPGPNAQKTVEDLQKNAGKDFIVQTELKFGEEHVAKDDFEVFALYSYITAFYSGSDSATNQLSVSLLRVSSDGEIVYLDNGTKTKSGIFLTPGADFTTLSIHVHPEKNKYDLYIDGKLYKKDIVLFKSLSTFSSCVFYYNVVNGEKVYDFVYHTLTSDKKIDKRYAVVSADDTLDSNGVYYRATYVEKSSNNTCRYIDAATVKALTKNADGSYTYPTDLGTKEIVVKEVVVSSDAKTFNDLGGNVLGTICTIADYAPHLIRMYQYASTTEQSRLCVNDTFFYYSDTFVTDAVATGKYETSHTHNGGTFTITKTEADNPEAKYQISGAFGENGNLGNGAWVAMRSVGLAECVSVRLYVSVDKAAVSPDARFDVTHNGVTITYTLDALKQDKDGYYVISQAVDSIDMAKPVTVKFRIGDAVSDKEYTTSVKDYANELINLYPKKEYIVNVAKALLNYGAYAQKYFKTKGYDVDLNDLANAGVEINLNSVFVDSEGLEPELTFTGAASELENISASLVLVSGTKLKIYFDYSGNTKVNFNNMTDGAVSYTPSVDEDGNTYVVLTGIRPDQYHRVVSLVTKTKDGSNYYINTELKLSVLSVIDMVLNSNTSSQEHKDLMKAMYNYHKAVLNYKEELKKEAEGKTDEDMSDVDENFKVETDLTGVEGLVFYDVEKDSRFEIYGVQREGDYLVRMPEATASAIGADVLAASRDTAGGRIRFTTNSPYLAVHIETDVIEGYADMPLTGTVSVDAYRRQANGEYTFATVITPALTCIGKTVFEGYKDWYSSSTYDYTLNLPSFVNIKKVYIGLKEGSFIAEPTYEYKDTAPMVFYGGATTQGLGAPRVGITYPSLIARRFDTDYVNLGLANSTLGQEKMAEYIASLDMSMFVYDYDYGVDAEHLAATHKSFFDKIRESQPDLPIIITTRAASYVVPGHASFDIPYATYQAALAKGDENVYFVSGNELVKYCGTDAFANGDMPSHLAIYSAAQVLGDKIADILAGKENVVYDPDTMIDMSIAGINIELSTYGNADTANITWINPEDDTNPMEIYGVFREGDRFVRMPKNVAEAVRDEANIVKPGSGDGVLKLYDETSGGRVRFKTDSKYVAIKVTMPKVSKDGKFSLVGASGFDLYATINGQETFIGTFAPPYELKSGGSFEAVIPLSGELYDYTINMPNYAAVSSIEIGVENGATLQKATAYKSDKAIYYYGSSITQGASPSRPGLAYENIVSRATGYDFVNLGFSGNCKAEQAMIDYLVSIVDKMEVFVYDYDHNANSDAHYAETHERLFLALREARPDLPIIIMVRPSAGQKNSSRYNTAWTTYQNALAKGDTNVYFIDGDQLTEFSGRDGTADVTHPSDIGFYSMSLPVTEVLEQIFLKSENSES